MITYEHSMKRRVCVKHQPAGGWTINECRPRPTCTCRSRCTPFHIITLVSIRLSHKQMLSVTVSKTVHAAVSKQADVSAVFNV